VRAALSWLDEQGENDAMLRLCAMLSGVWFARGLYHEGVQWVEQALAQSSRMPSVALARALSAAGMLAIFEGDHARAERFLRESQRVANELGDSLLVAEAQIYAAQLSQRRGDYDRADNQARDVQRRLSEIGSNLPEVKPLTGLALLILGAVATLHEQFNTAELYLEEAVDLFRAVGSAWGLSDAQAGLAAVRLCVGDIPTAASLYWQSLERARAIGLGSLFTSPLLGLAVVAPSCGPAKTGAHLLGAAEGFAAALGAPIFSRDRPIRERAMASLRAALGPERFDAEREVGRAGSLASALAAARLVADAFASPSP
jgi:tetratricopeptide (TPR) repeat protein